MKISELKRKLVVLLTIFSVVFSFAQTDCELRWSRFTKDIDATTDIGKALVTAIDENPETITSWWVFDTVGEDALRTNLDELSFVTTHLKTKNKTAETIVDEIKNAGSYSKWKGIVNAGDDVATLLAKYRNIRKYLDDGQVKAYLNSNAINKFTDLLKKAHPDVLSEMEKMDVDDFGEMVRGYLDNPKKFEEVIVVPTDFIGTLTRPGFLEFWKLTPKMKDGLTTIKKLKQEGKLLPTGNATSIQLASIQNYTAWGNFVNVPMRYGAHFGEYAEKAKVHIEEGLELLRKVTERNMAGKDVFSGRAYSLEEFNKLFIGKKGMEVEINRGFISSSLDENVAKHFANLTSEYIDNPIKVIRRIETKTGVYLDDLADYGINLGSIRHADRPPIEQMQKEVLMKEGLFKQLNEPELFDEVNGVKWYYIDFIELDKPLK